MNHSSLQYRALCHAQEVWVSFLSHVTNKERTELLPRTERGSARAVESENKELNKTSGRLNDGIPQVPVKRGESEFDSFRQSLPALEKQEEIVQTIKDNKIVLIIGETGLGKTTQIPQFILDDCYKNGAPCHVFCTQPRCLAAVAVAERVAAERREKIGQTIGYQLRLESSSASFEGFLLEKVWGFFSRANADRKLSTEK
ncbi:3'-5' RNA helicase YTHDC2-like isoform X3 [Corvus hawaiiensis]|uniref:3'-5' RNA helicase YTHDC2-like isoform X3 n=1 Tax=Corvus hawaiiensis TaxID=134902 RepID=UPI002019E03E|nr:3'-5' RNA helicase YTHDC2-like isoform X3 [Corvus hawaiiensis]